MVRLAAKRLGVYVRTTLVLVVLVAIGAVLFNNRKNEVSVWFFGLTDEAAKTNVVWLILCTAAGTLVTWWVLRMGRRLLRDVREIERVREKSRIEQAQRERETQLAEREKRIDEKLRRGITAEASDAEDRAQE
jgi:uncharacterized membrane-anchored protein